MKLQNFTRKKVIQAFLVLFITSSSVGSLFAQNNGSNKLPSARSENEFFTDNSSSIPNSRKETLTNISGDDSATLQNLINNLSQQGNGIITIPAGTWHFGEIEMKSNIHLRIHQNAIIKPTINSNLPNYSIFRIGYTNYKSTNVSIRSISGLFTIDLTGLAPETRITPFNVKEAENFMVAGCNVKDKQTIHATLNCSASQRGGVWRGPINGLVKNITVQNAHGGYGAIQVRTGENLFFKNINSLSGGVSLRIETDDVSASGGRIPQNVAIANKISGYNIRCKDGNAAVMIQPWGAKNGWFDVEKIEAIGCMAAVRIDKAYVELNAPSIGTFSNKSRITDITKVTYGVKAQVKQGVFPWVPCNLRTNRNILKPNPIPNMETYHQGPSIAPVLYRASNSTSSNDPRLYTVNIPSENAISSVTTGFPNNSLIISRENNQVGTCTNSNIVSSELEEEVKVYPNPVSGNNVTIAVKLKKQGNLDLRVYDFNGKLVYNNQLGNFNAGNQEFTFTKQALNIKEKGMYIVEVSSNNTILKKHKVLVK
ncbi:T9SS type A sorting domain-containing protein [Cellulophaga fucicola]|uniref:Por secretion system C-terminal sorting domain-containing protein n=1 Tax=Cellulophaga fucicola TaxID=76595 RepID=A0A1K1MWG5_9FLAO|nr:T9SS type A sorting domain-containing protein [Cellulophaga fucicola]SFW27451.1 Por secretion system C-terminal sorting domain-containing protein [Cellulophaga fucicola]